MFIFLFLFCCYWLQEKERAWRRGRFFTAVQTLHQGRTATRDLFHQAPWPAGNSDYWSAGEDRHSCLAVLYSEIIPVREHFIWWRHAFQVNSVCVFLTYYPLETSLQKNVVKSVKIHLRTLSKEKKWTK